MKGLVMFTLCAHLVMELAAEDMWTLKKPGSFGRDAKAIVEVAGEEVRMAFDGQQDWALAVEESVRALGLDESLIAAGTSEEFDAMLRASHEEGISMVGQDVGTPVIAVPGADGDRVAFFGPVVTPAPKGEAAGRLWDGTLLVAATPGFFELKRTRTVDPIFD